jgi:[pyruvate, water dikinase]-phosphate phosphotransferase / [pyruvate, water dikinase] kinase
MESNYETTAGEASPYRIFVVSDGTGATAERVVQAALTQFTDAWVAVERRPQVRSRQAVNDVVQEAAGAGGCIVHTLVLDTLREEMVRAGRLANVETIDLMGPLLARLSQQLSTSPAEKPGLFRQLNKEYFRRIESMEFAFHHDDGRRAHELDRAELVLIGVSRTFKTPLSIYLAFKGWFVANVPVIWDKPLPPGLLEIPPSRVFGLRIDPARLAELRQAREERWGAALGPYATLDYVRRETAYAEKIYQDHPGWRVIDVTDKPIEEIASEILVLTGKRRR